MRLDRIHHPRVRSCACVCMRDCACMRVCAFVRARFVEKMAPMEDKSHKATIKVSSDRNKWAEDRPNHDAFYWQKKLKFDSLKYKSTPIIDFSHCHRRACPTSSRSPSVNYYRYRLHKDVFIFLLTHVVVMGRRQVIVHPYLIISFHYPIQ